MEVTPPPPPRFRVPPFVGVSRGSTTRGNRTCSSEPHPGPENQDGNINPRGFCWKIGSNTFLWKSWFLGRGWRQQLFSFQSLFVGSLNGQDLFHWIAFPVEILTKPLIYWMSPPFSQKIPFFSLKSFVAFPCQKSAPTLGGCFAHLPVVKEFVRFRLAWPD